MWKSSYFCDYELSDLSDLYALLYPNHSNLHIPRKHLLFSDLKVLGEHFTSNRSRSQRSSAVMAYWGDALSVKVGLIDYFLLHTVKNSDNRENENIFAKVKWYQDHLRAQHYYSPTHIVCTLFEHDNKYSFIPVSRLLCRCAVSPRLSLSFDYGQDYAIAVSPYFLTNAQL